MLNRSFRTLGQGANLGVYWLSHAVFNSAGLTNLLVFTTDQCVYLEMYIRTHFASLVWSDLPYPQPSWVLHLTNPVRR